MSERPLRAVFVTGSLVHGGAERHSITVMNRLAERGHQCHAVYVKDDPSQLPRIRLAREGTVLCLHASRYLDAAAVERFAAHLARVKPSVIVAANPYALMYAVLARHKAGIQAAMVVTWHSTLVLNAKEWLQLLVYRIFFRVTDCAVFVCERQRRYWMRRLLRSRRNEVIYNGVDLELFSSRSPEAGTRDAIRERCGFQPGDFVIGLSAVLRPEKNPVQLVEAVAALRRRNLPAKALFIGDGALRGAVEARARELGIAAHVLVSGFQQEVRPWIAACDTLVLCSVTEAFSLAAIEAMALEKPVVHADVGGAAEMIVPGWNGYLYPPGDTAALVQRLALLAEPAARARLGRAAREVVEEFFSEDKMVSRYENTLIELTAQRG